MQEFGRIQLGHAARPKRFTRILAQLAPKPECSAPQACGSKNQVKALYSFVSSKFVTEEAIVNVHRDVTLERIRASDEDYVLVPQDTTTFNYSGLKKTKGLGPIGANKSLRGLLMHTAIAVTPSGAVLGALRQKIWARPIEAREIKDTRKSRPIEEKESYRWQETMSACERGDHGKSRLVHIADREGDVYAFQREANLNGWSYLCRRVHDRKIEGGDAIESFINGLASAGTYCVDVPRDSHTGREFRKASLEIRFGEVEILRPKALSVIDYPEASIKATVISAREANAPEGVDPIDWELITNLDTPDYETAVKYVKWYTRRWMIETFHYTLKSGCHVEKLQLKEASRLAKMIEIYSIIALRIMIMTRLARTEPDEPCEDVLTEPEWKVLRWKTASKKKPLVMTPPTNKEAIILIGQLVGFHATKKDPFPGVKTIWRGLAYLIALAETLPFARAILG